MYSSPHREANELTMATNQQRNKQSPPRGPDQLAGGVRTEPEVNSPAPSIATAKIRVATIADLKFVVDLQKKFSNEVGFIPKAGIEFYCEQGLVRLVCENDEPAGYILGREKFRWSSSYAPITQAAVAMDAQRRHLGIALVNELARSAKQAGQLAIQATCKADLEANAFWFAAGFEEIWRLKRETADKVERIVWRRSLTTLPPDDFILPPPRSGHKARKNTTQPEK